MSTTPIEPIALRRLAESWVAHAHDLQRRYGTAAPNTVNHVMAALELCSNELIQIVDKAEYPAAEQPAANPS